MKPRRDPNQNVTGAISLAGVLLGIAAACNAPQLWAQPTLSDPAVLEFALPEYRGNENDATVRVTVRRTGSSNGPVCVNYATTNGTATAGQDYVACSGTLCFASGESRDQTISVPILNDALSEGEETFFVTLSSPRGGAALGSPQRVHVVIQDDEAPTVTLMFAAPEFRISENGGLIQVPVRRIGSAEGTVCATYATTDGTAMSGEDYLTRSGTVCFAGGDTRDQFISIPIIDNTLLESDESFTLTLSNPEGGAELGNHSVVQIVILDDEACRLSAAYNSTTEQVQLTLSSTLPARFVVEASTDLSTWTPLATVTNAQGRTVFCDSPHPNLSQRFFRTRLME